jgi:hypothetical protein
VYDGSCTGPTDVLGLGPFRTRHSSTHRTTLAGADSIITQGVGSWTWRLPVGLLPVSGYGHKQLQQQLSCAGIAIAGMAAIFNTALIIALIWHAASYVYYWACSDRGQPNQGELAAWASVHRQLQLARHSATQHNPSMTHAPHDWAAKMLLRLSAATSLPGQQCAAVGASHAGLLLASADCCLHRTSQLSS